MHYRKGENIEKQLTKDELPFEDFLPKGTDFLWMHVSFAISNIIELNGNEQISCYSLICFYLYIFFLQKG